MKDLNLVRAIPLSAAGALVVVGCGGRSIGYVEADDSDPLSDQAFGNTLFETYEDLCEKQYRCGDSGTPPSECATYYAEYFSERFDLDTRHCRELAIDALSCLAEIPGCRAGYDDCEGPLIEFIEDCGDFSYSYYYYDY